MRQAIEEGAGLPLVAVVADLTQERVRQIIAGEPELARRYFGADNPRLKKP